MSEGTSARMGGAVAYVVMGFPRVSESFISNEILLLESMGVELAVFAVKPGDERSHESLAGLRSNVEYLPRMTSLSGTTLWRWLRENMGPYWPAHRRLLRQRPLAWLSVAASALSMCWRYRKARLGGLRKVFIKEFLQAGAIAERIVREKRFARLHGHFCHGAATITWFASRLTGLPFSFTAHAKDIYQADQNPGDLLRRKLRAARFVVTCTEANRRHLKGIAFNAGRDIHTVYHGLDTNFFQPRSAPASDVPLILSVGRFVEKKGLHHLVETCARLRDQQVRFRCLLVGEQGSELDRILRLRSERGLESVIEIRSPVTHRELREIYAAASIFVLPCLVAADGDRDGIPNVLAEAMAMGLPVVTTPVSGIPELVEGGVNGVLVNPGDPAALAAQIRGLLEDTPRRAQLGGAARATICAHFDSRRTTLALRNLFAGVDPSFEPPLEVAGCAECTP